MQRPGYGTARANLVTTPQTSIEQNTSSTSDGWGWNLDWTAELKAGERAFAEQGFWQTHVTDITRRAGCSVGGFYRRFHDKEAFFMALQADKTFERVLAGSLILTFFVYVFVNVGMVIGLLPVVGVPLPLISYGGTAMVTLMAGFGILMSVYSHRRFVSR